MNSTRGPIISPYNGPNGSLGILAIVKARGAGCRGVCINIPLPLITCGSSSIKALFLGPKEITGVKWIYRS